ncbi:MAG TPA: hypothetical protein VFO44_13570 [Steroidobacteraceae bacterium]|nr:hypothetical protein [Steroidobacteraceae bacterium]
MRAVGLRVRSGVALCVVIEGSSESWRVVASRAVRLSPDGDGFARFPFHPLVELGGPAGIAASRKAVAAVRITARRQMATLLADVGAVDGAGIVTGSLLDPERIGSPHMQAHAREGQLFREVVASGLKQARTRFEVLSDRDLVARLADRRRTSVADVNRLLTQAGRGTFRPWAAHQKLAAAGALWSLP